MLERQLVAELAAMEGTEAAVVLSSAEAALAFVLLALLRSGDHLLVSRYVRGSTRSFVEQELPRLGVTASFVDSRNPRSWRQALSTTTRALFMEAPSLEEAEYHDLSVPRKLAQELGLALLVDSTAASPVLLRPAAQGADVVIHDGRFLLAAAGGNPVGVVCGSEGLLEEVSSLARRWGGSSNPSALLSLETGLQTLEVRVRKQSRNIARLAEQVAGERGIAGIRVPQLPAISGYETNGVNCIISLEREEAAKRMVELFAAAVPGEPDTSYGASYPAGETYGRMSSVSMSLLTTAVRLDATPDAAFRVGLVAGLESIADITSVIQEALK